jgi:hypothetical protein
MTPALRLRSIPSLLVAGRVLVDPTLLLMATRVTEGGHLALPYDISYLRTQLIPLGGIAGHSGARSCPTRQFGRTGYCT